MDMLFQRYANPFPFVDGMIHAGMFSSFVSSFMETVQEEKDDEMTWQYYLHKVFQGSFNDFKEALLEEEKHKNMSQFDIEATVKNSMDILNNFNPDKKDGDS